MSRSSPEAFQVRNMGPEFDLEGDTKKNRALGRTQRRARDKTNEEDEEKGPAEGCMKERRNEGEKGEENDRAKV